MGEIQRSLREWAEFFNVPFGTFRGWAYELNKRSPFYHSDARIIAAHGAGKASNGRGNAAIAAKRNYTNVMEKLTVD
jgi:hypothetical protein